MSLETTRAFKEWAIAIQALEAGEMIILLRKGGIRETQHRFQVNDNKSLIWLYPTYEHQKPALLKPFYASQVSPVASGWHPETVKVTSGAIITNVLELTKENQVKCLFTHHIWSEKWVSDRRQWKPQHPLSLLLLRVYRLPDAIALPYHSTYGGCKSWIDLQYPISQDGLVPVFTNTEYSQQRDYLFKLLHENQ